jgi:hypothetical protein
MAGVIYLYFGRRVIFLVIKTDSARSLDHSIRQMYMMLTVRFWRAKAVLLCALLLQNCQSNSLRATEEEEPAAGASCSSAMLQRAPSGPLATPSLAPLSASPAAHTPPSRFSTTSANKPTPSIAPSSLPLSPPARRVLATVGNYKAPYHLQPAARPCASHTVPIGNAPSHAPSPDGPRAHSGKVDLLRGMPSAEKENAKKPAKRPLLHLEDALAEGNKKARIVERCVRRDTLSTLLDVARLAPDEAAGFLEVLFAATRDNQFRQRALEALGKVAQASPDRVSQCLTSLRAAAKEGDKAVRLLALRTLGVVEWKNYFGDVGPAPALPSDIGTILDSPCPFWPAKKVRDTHLLVLIPATVDGAPFTLNSLGELIQHPKNGGHEMGYRYYGNSLQAQFGEVSPDRSYWLLMTREVLEGGRGSRDKVYSAQRALVARHARRTDYPYEMPGALEAATAILIHHACTGERLFGDDPRTYTRCLELVDSKYPVVVGGFESSGLCVSNSRYDFRVDGVAGCRRF